MKIIQVPFCYYPDPIGGTEIYVEGLSKGLQKLGPEIVIASPGERKSVAFYNELKVRRFPVSGHLRLEELYGAGDPLALKEFIIILEEEKPDIVHLHAFTSANSLPLVRAAKKRGIKVFFTYHTPAASCQRGTLIYNGKRVCDGYIDINRCARCALSGLGLSRPLAYVVGGLPPFAGRLLGALNLKGRFSTALRMSELVSYFNKAFHELFLETDHVVAVCNWARDLLTKNNIPEGKISIIRQGLSGDISEEPQPSYANNGPLKLAYFGRIHPTKGLHILIKAFSRVPDINLTLDIYGILQQEDRYYNTLQNMAKEDNRISFKQPVPSKEVIRTMRYYDIITVPSQWLETGPMVVLEAFAAGVVPVGSDLGGISELIEDGVNGVLLEAEDVAVWAHTLKKFSNKREMLKDIRKGITKPITMDHVAYEMLKLYKAFNR